MLIASERHTEHDLREWRTYEEMDLIESSRVEQMHREAHSACALFVFARPPCYAGVSWGKDSVVIAYLLWCAARNVPLVHLRPSNHNPDCDAVRDDYFKLFPGQPYYEIPVDYTGIRYDLPHQERDRLTDQKWNAAIRECERRFGKRHILGIRGEESVGRAIRMSKWGLESPNALAPIGYWKNGDVFRYLALFDLPVHPAYAMLGNGRWPRDRIRVAEIGDSHGTGGGRREWEEEYYGDVLRRLEAANRNGT